MQTAPRLFEKCVILFERKVFWAHFTLMLCEGVEAGDQGTDGGGVSKA